MNRLTPLMLACVTTICVGCGAGPDATEEVSAAVSLELSSEGFFAADDVSPTPIIALYNGRYDQPLNRFPQSYYCHVEDDGSFLALSVAYGNILGNAFGNGNLPVPFVHTTLNQISWVAGQTGGSGNPNVLCPWPSGMFIRDGAVYLVQNSTYRSYGTACHLIADWQINNHGGWGRVWDPRLSGASIKFEDVTLNPNTGRIIGYGHRVPDCTS